MLGEVCRSYGKWPHELGDLPPAERQFVVTEYHERLKERSEGNGTANQSTDHLNGI